MHCTVFFSFAVGHMKPDRRVYSLVESVAGINPEDILFFDDRQINVDGARLAGWNAVLTDGHDAVRVRQEIEAFTGIVF